MRQFALFLPSLWIFIGPPIRWFWASTVSAL